MVKRKGVNLFGAVKKREWLGKLAGTIGLFLLATAALVLSRGSTLLIVAQTQQRELTRCGVSCEREEKVFEDEDARPAWLWTLLLALTIPHCVTLIHNLILIYSKWDEFLMERKYGQKRWKLPDRLYVCLQPIFAALQTAGICILFFIALPEFSSAKAALITSLVAWFSGLLKMINKPEGLKCAIVYKI